MQESRTLPQCQCLVSTFAIKLVTVLSVLIGWDFCHLCHVFVCFFSVSANSPLAIMRPAGHLWRHQLLSTGQDDVPEDPVVCQQSGREPHSHQIYSLPL